MALFRRNRADDLNTVPEEVSTYYQAEKRDRAWMAWLLALLSLAVTALVVMALFFGGRWVYRKVRPNPGPATPIAVQKPGSESGTDKNKNTSSNTGTTSNPPASTSPSNGNVNAPANPATPPAGSGTTGAPSSSATTPAPNTPPATTTGPADNSKLATTGPGDTMAIFATVFIVGTVFHYYFLGKPQSSKQ